MAAILAGYLIGKGAAPTKGEATKLEREAFEGSFRNAYLGASAKGGRRGLVRGQQQGRRSGLEQGQSRGEEAGGEAAAAELAAIQAEEQRQLEEAAAAGAIISLSCPPGYVWAGPMTDSCIPQ